MCTKSYKDRIKKIAREITDGEKPVIIIGDNAVGKSDVIGRVAKNLLGHVYFIDAVNRCFDLEKINSTPPAPQQRVITEKDVDARLQEEFFNKKDTFAQQDSIERWYALYADELQQLMNAFWQRDVRIDSVQVGEIGTRFTAYESGEQIQLSSGYQAVLRILAECIVCRDYLRTDSKQIVVLIDEIDEFLSARSAGKILNFLTESFPKFRFVVSTHSADVLFQSKNYILTALTGNDYLIYDGNDLNSITDVYILFKHIFLKDGSSKRNEKQALTDALSYYLNLKLMGTWSKEAEQDFSKIQTDKMTNSQKFLYQQIKRWNT